MIPSSPVELATLWASQFGIDAPAKKHIAELTPVAADFLSWLETEL